MYCRLVEVTQTQLPLCFLPWVDEPELMQVETTAGSGPGSVPLGWQCGALRAPETTMQLCGARGGTDEHSPKAYEAPRPLITKMQRLMPEQGSDSFSEASLSTTFILLP